ncbi:MAG: bifunctional metallophosphatase/5'-nucleotidase [Burkholderiales bacterium]|nr:bifunctional metallophosphatase/5'-nucleotidase [Burkholderiales bacterium]
MKRISFVLAAAVLCASCGQAPKTTSTLLALSATVEVKIIAFNDFHGNLRTPSLRVAVPDASQSTGIRFDPAGGIEQFSALVQSLKAMNKNVAVVSAGDMVGATPLLSALFMDEPTIEAMNLVGVDIHAVGNHEFDYGVKHLKRLKEGGCKLDEKTGQPDCGGRPPYAGAKFDFLAANVIVNATGQPLFPAFAVREFEGIKIGFIGLTTRTTPSIVRPGGTVGLTFKDEVETINALVPALKAQGIEAIVVLMHEGGVQAGTINQCIDFQGRGREIAEGLDPAVQVVITAHTHRYYICELGDKLVTEAGSYGTVVTDIDLVIDRSTRKIIAKKARNLVVDPKGAKDAVLTTLVDSYAKLSAPLENRVVGKITREASAVVGPSGESTLGNLIADAHLFGTAAPDRGGAVIAFNNPGSLRAPIIPDAEGGVKYGELFKSQPFQNDLIIMTLTGNQIKNLLEQQFGSADRARLLGVSKGFSYTWDNARPRGEKVVPGSMKLNGAAVEPSLQYRVTANSFLAGGSEGMGMFREGTERQVGMLDLEALVEMIAAGSPYTPPSVGRLTRLN